MGTNELRMKRLAAIIEGQFNVYSERDNYATISGQHVFDRVSTLQLYSNIRNFPKPNYCVLAIQKQDNDST